VHKQTLNQNLWSDEVFLPLVLCFSVFESIGQMANGGWTLDWRPVYSRPEWARSAETGSELKPELKLKRSLVPNVNDDVYVSKEIKCQ